MKDDYLWDRSGETDAEVQELEELLGVLRYQPRPLEIPQGVQAAQPRPFSAVTSVFAPRLAIAATLAMILLGLGLWLGVQRGQQPALPEVSTAQKIEAPTAGEQRETAAVPAPKNTDVAVMLSLETGRREPLRRASATMSATRRQEGEAAKAQLMLALRVASLKLNLAQKKALNTNPRDPVQNQHKVG